MSKDAGSDQTEELLLDAAARFFSHPIPNVVSLFLLDTHVVMRRSGGELGFQFIPKGG